MVGQFRARRLAVALLAMLLIGFAAAFTALPAFAEAGSAASPANGPSLVVGEIDDEAAQAVEPVCIEEINPIYAEELADADLFGDEASPAEQKAADTPSLRSSERGAGESAAKSSDAVVYESQEEATAVIRAELFNYAEEISVTLKTDSNYAKYGFPMFYAALAEPDEGSSLEDETMVDYVRYSYLAARCSCTGTHTGEVYTITYVYRITYSCTPAQTRQVLDHAQQLVESFGFGDGTGDVQKAKTIYDYICANVVYDDEHLNNDNHLLKYSAYAALENGTAVCQGYSQLLTVMCGYAGVSTRIISGIGNGGAHAWNIIGLAQEDGSRLYYNVDSTWDSSCYQDNVPYEYFLRSDEEFPDHERGDWGDVVEYWSPEFYATHPMADASYEATVETIDNIEYALLGNEATARAYLSADSSSTEIVIPETVEFDGETYTVKTIGASFLGTKRAAGAAKAVVLPSTITTIESWAFFGTAITEINLPESLLRIGMQAFSYCDNLAEITLPASLESVGVKAFEGCSGLETVRVLGPTSIGKGAFVDLANGSEIWVSTPCLKALLVDGGKTFITPSLTEVHLAEPDTTSPGHRLRHIDECPAMCEVPGCIEYWQCRVCGKLFADSKGANSCKPADTIIDPMGHEWDDGVVTTNPTCTKEGELKCTCVRCGEKQVETIEALGHDYETVATTDPTCTDAGRKTLSCTRCDEAYAEVIPALGHSFTNYVSNEDATCNDDGTKTAMCDHGCGTFNTVADEGSALGHAWDDGVVTRKPTALVEGEITYTCLRCGVTEPEPIPTTSWELIETIPATCEKDGYHLYRNNTSGEKETVPIPALGHYYESVVTEPTCTADGYTTHTCVHCKASHVDSETPACGHTSETDAAVAPTCTAAGLTEGSHCSVCGEVLVAQETVSALGHDYISVITAPTCISAGYTTHICARCGDSYVDAKTAALGHSWDAGKVTTAPTYTAQGVKTFTCAHCGATRVELMAMLPKLAQTISPAKKTYTVKFSKVKKKAQKVAVKFKATGGGAITYKAAKTAGGKVKIAKNGKVTVAKGTKKGTYTLKVKVTAAATTSHDAITMTVKLKVRVK